jgi:hypothetical protein
MIKNIPAGASLFDVGGERRQRVRRRQAASRFRPSSTFCSNASSTFQSPLRLAGHDDHQRDSGQRCQAGASPQEPGKDQANRANHLGHPEES